MVAFGAMREESELVTSMGGLTDIFTICVAFNICGKIYLTPTVITDSRIYLLYLLLLCTNIESEGKLISMVCARGDEMAAEDVASPPTVDSSSADPVEELPLQDGKVSTRGPSTRSGKPYGSYRVMLSDDEDEENNIDFLRNFLNQRKPFEVLTEESLQERRDQFNSKMRWSLASECYY